LTKAKVSPEVRTDALQIADHLCAQTVDLTVPSSILMITGNTDKLDAMIKLMGKFTIVELVRTGKVVMARGEQET